MHFRYTAFDPNVSREINRHKITKLFLDLLNKFSGDAQSALEQLQRIWDKHGLDRAMGMTFEEFKEYLKEKGLLDVDPRTGAAMPTKKSDREIQRAAFEEIFGSLLKDHRGDHALRNPGGTGDRLPESRTFEFGDDLMDLNYTASLGNALRRTGFDEFSLGEEDLETFQREDSTSAATVILIDISHSMILYGEDRITPAKNVAMALVEYIRQKYPKDSIDVALFGDDAVEVPVDQLARVSVGPYHTNTKAGLQLAQKLLLRRKAINKQVFMITDGKPSAIHEDGVLYKNPFGLDPKIVSQTINEAIQLRRKGIAITTFMITTDPYLQDFVDRLTRANNGRAYYATLDNLGSYIFADYAKNKKKRV